jgi:hypothetical protein
MTERAGLTVALIVLVILLLSGWSGPRTSGTVYAGGGIGLVLVVLLIAYLLGLLPVR